MTGIIVGSTVVVVTTLICPKSPLAFMQSAVNGERLTGENRELNTAHRNSMLIDETGIA